MSNQNNGGLSIQQHANGSFVSNYLLTKAKTNDTDAFYRIGVLVLQNKEVDDSVYILTTKSFPALRNKAKTQA